MYKKNASLIFLYLIILFLIKKIHGTVEHRVGIIMGSDSDFPVMRDAAKVLDTFGVPYEVNFYI